MSVRRKTTNRLTLSRSCGTSGREFGTTADTPWVRSIIRDDKRQVTTYFCSEKCFAASYKHIGWYDGKAAERRKLKDRNRDPVKERARCRRYNAEHKEARREYARRKRLENPGLVAADNAYYKKKRKLLAQEATS